MDILVIVLCWLLLPLSLTWCITLISQRSKKLPPGPATFPVIGNLHLVGTHPHKSLTKLAKTHGPIMSLKFGQKLVIAISSSAVAEEVLRKHDMDFSSRSLPDVINGQDHSKYSVIWLPVGPEWKFLRKIMTTHVFSGNRLDASQRLRSQKVNELISYCKQRRETGEAVDISGAAFRTSLNLLSNIIFSRNLTDPLTDSGKEFKDLVWEILEAAAKPNVVDFFPIFRRLDPQGARRRMDAMVGKMLEMFRSLMTERLESRIHESQSMDLLDDLLELSRGNPDQINGSVIEHFFIDMFVAGTDTTSATLEWGMAELLRNPRILKKLQAELGEVIGRGKVIEETDLPRLPYLDCVLKETLRMHPSVPLAIRKAGRDVEVCGYVVPEESQVLVNAWAIGRDEKVWEDPMVFKPERFFELEWDFRGRDFEFIPFGGGRRICPGLNLAVRIVPLALGSLLNVFDWKLEGGIAPEELDMEEKFGLTLQKAQPLRAIPVAI